MSIYARGEPTANHQFRDNTERYTRTMAGVTSTPSRRRCVCCLKMRTEATGRDTSAGFICGMCSK